MGTQPSEPVSIDRVASTTKSITKGQFKIRFLHKSSSGPKPQVKPKHKWDKMPQEAELIFETNIKKHIEGFKIFTSLSAIVIPSMAVYYQYYNPNPDKLPGHNYFMILPVVVVLSLTSFVHIYCRRMFTRIYFDTTKHEFVGIRRTIFWRCEHFRFTSDDVKLKNMNSDMSEGCIAMIKGRTISLNAYDFSTPAWYNRILGADHEMPQSARTSAHHHRPFS